MSRRGTGGGFEVACGFDLGLGLWLGGLWDDGMGLLWGWGAVGW